jgi:hypothetical protein
VTPLTVGAVVSIAMLLFALREPAAPGLARVSVELLPAGSAIVPPLRPSEPVAA